MATHRSDPDYSGDWSELFNRAHRSAAIVLSGGVVLYATNIFLTASVLPDVVDEIGGRKFYAWVTTVFLLASVISAVMVSAVLSRLGARNSYLMALSIFAVGTIICAVVPNMPLMLTGRFIQGFGGGLLTGLGYALIRSMFPEALWAKGSALVSAMWGVGTFLGPVMGGVFAQIGMWRGAFLALLLATVLMTAVVPFAISSTRSGDVPPAVSPLTVLLLVISVLLVGLSNIVDSTTPLLSLIAGALVLLVLATAYDRHRGGEILPRSTFSLSSPLPWCYGAVALLSISSQIENFVPLFAQNVAMLGPLLAGFVGAAIALGWTLGEIPSASVKPPKARSVVATLGPAMITIGFLSSALLTRTEAGTISTALWVIAMLIGGAGIGVAWPHVASRIMGGIAEGDNGDTAAAAINTTQLVSNAIGSAIVGVLVHIGRPEPTTQSVTMFAGISVAGLLGIWCIWQGTAAWRRKHPVEAASSS